MEFIFDITTRLKFLSSRHVPVELCLVTIDSMSSNDNLENIERTSWFLIPYTNKFQINF